MYLLPIERQKRIKEIVSKRKFVKISELSADLGVSEMTIHRDIKPLIEAGLVQKTFGGICLAAMEEQIRQENSCVYCAQTVQDRFAYRLILAHGRIEEACCAHCGLLRHWQVEEHVQQAICHDFLRQTTMNATLATYVLDSSIQITCCKPQVLTFELAEHAAMFVRGFGGSVHAFTEAREIVLERMKAFNHPCCHGKKMDSF